MTKRSATQIIGIIAVLFFSAGCGSSEELGRVGDHPITRQEYLSVFNGLPAEEQVEVLEPGGRMELMERIVRKRLLLLAWEEDPSISADNEYLYSASFLADSMLRRIAQDYDPQAYMDSLAACGYSSFTLRTVLLDDSAQAASLADSWNQGTFPASVPSLPAPWSGTDGSSQRIISGPIHRLTTNFMPFMDADPGTAVVLPMYGEWCVGMLDLHQGEWILDESAASTGMMNLISRRTGETVLAGGIMELASHCEVSGTTLIPSGDGSPVPLFIAGGDTSTVADMISIMRTASPENFYGQVPGEISVFSPPQLTISPMVTLWFHVNTVAQRLELAEMAAVSGITLDEGTMDYPRAESVVRERVLGASIPDSSSIARWYDENSSNFVLPERRSVLLGYTDSVSAASVDLRGGIAGIEGLQTVADSSGNPVPTPLQVMESFGEVLGPEIFAAEPGVPAGPVFLQGELAAWFEVVEVAPPGVAELDEIYPVVAASAAGEFFDQGFEELMDSLRSVYGVEVDTAAVSQIDLWGSVE